MKKILLTALVLLSLGFNAALVMQRLSENPTKLEPTLVAPSPPRLDVSWHGLDDHELPTFLANLRAAGVPDRFIRALIKAKLDETFLEQETALLPPKQKLKFWQRDDRPRPMQTRLALLDLHREKAKIFNDLLGPDSGEDDNLPAAYHDLPPEKREAVRLIKEDYDTMLAALREQAGLFPLAADREQIAFLEKEKQDELHEQLNPSELEQLEIRTSSLGAQLSRELQNLNLTDAQFRAIYAAKSTLDSYNRPTPGQGMFVPSTPEEMHARDEEVAQIKANLKATLGDDLYGSYVRTQDYDYQRLSGLLQRAGYSPVAAEVVYTLRDQAASESSRIYNDTTLDLPQQVAALKALAAKTKLQMSAQIGTEATEAYTHSTFWFRTIEQARGAVSFTENGLSVRPLAAED